MEEYPRSYGAEAVKMYKGMLYDDLFNYKIDIRNVSNKQKELSARYKKMEAEVKRFGVTDDIKLKINQLKEDQKKLEAQKSYLADKGAQFSRTERTLNTAAYVLAKETFDKEESIGSTLGFLYNSALNALKNFGGGGALADSGIALLGAFTPLSPEQQALVDAGATEQEVRDKNITEGQKKIGDDFNKGLQTMAASNTKDAYMKSEDRSEVLTGFGAGIESMGAYLGGGGNKYGQFAKFFQMSYDHIRTEMRDNPNFKDVGVAEQMGVASLYSVGIGFLETIGFRAVMGKNPALNGFLQRQVEKAIASVPKGATQTMLIRAMEKVMSNSFASKIFSIGDAGLIEFGTEGVQAAVMDVEYKNVYNMIKDKEIFDVPAIGSDEAKDYVMKNARVGLFAGASMGLLRASVNIAKRGFNEANFEFKGQANDYAKVLQGLGNSSEFRDMNNTYLQTQIAQGNMTTAEAKTASDDFNGMMGVMNSIPPQVENVAEAYDLVKEKQQLEVEINNKDAALTVSERNRVSEINKNLEELSTKTKEAPAAEVEVTEEKTALTGRPSSQTKSDAGPNINPSAVQPKTTEETPSQKKVFRAGDLTVKAEPITKFELTNRSTGHFGTGFYFFGKRADAETSAKGTGTETSSRIVSEIDLNNYNLAKATLSLHEELKRINDNEFNDKDITSFDIERIAKESGLPIKERQENPYQEFLVRNNREYEALVSKYGEAKTEEMSDKASRIDLDTKAPYEDIANDINKKLKNKENKDTRSTLVMKALGFEGVDATGTDLDNSTYGTVVYDINPQEESLIKTQEDAIPKQSTETLDVQEQTRASEAMGEGDTEIDITTEQEAAQEADPTEVSEAAETEVDVDTQDRIDSEVESLDYIIKNPDFMLKTNNMSEADKEGMVQGATRVLESIQPELEGTPSLIQDPDTDFIPIPVKFTDNTELTDKVPKIKLSEIEGKKTNYVMADQLVTRGDKRGGPLFGLTSDKFGEVAWASVTDVASLSIVRGALDADFSTVYNMSPSAIDSNEAIFRDLSTEIAKAENKDEIFKAMMLELSTTKFKDIASKAKNISEFKKLYLKLSLENRKKILDKTVPTEETKKPNSSQKMLQDIGVSLEFLREKNSENFVKNLPAGVITTLFEVHDKQGNKLNRARLEDLIKNEQSYQPTIKRMTEEAKTPKKKRALKKKIENYVLKEEAIMGREEQERLGILTHPNYPKYIRGKVIGIMGETAPMWNINKTFRNTVNAKVDGSLKKKQKEKISKKTGLVTPATERQIYSNEARTNESYRADINADKTRKIDKAKRTNYETFIVKLSKSFPTVQLATNEEFEQLLKETQTKGLTTKTNKKNIYGAVYNGKLYLNPDRENYNTPIHEYGHIWTNVAEKIYPEIYKRGIELAEDSPYVEQIKNNKEYNRIIKQMRKDGATEQEIEKYILKEALATAIGDKGESFATAARRKSFATWLKDLFAAIKNLLGISKVTAEQLADMDLDDFTQAVVVDLMSETQLFKDAEVESLSNELQLMSVPANMSLESAISRARSKDISDAAILEYLKGRQVTQPATEQDVATGRASNIGAPIKKIQFKVADIKEALEVSTGRVLEPTKLPKEFMKVEDGAAQALELYDNVMKKLEDFAVQGPKGGKGKVGKRTKTDEEVQLKAQEILKAEPIYQEQFDAVQQELVVGIQKALKERLATRYMPRSVKEDIAAIKNNLRQQKIAEKDIKRKQEEIKAIIRKALPSFKGFSDVDINSLILKVARTTPTNFKIKVDEVLEKIENLRKTVKKAKINDIKQYINKKSKPKGLDAETKAYLGEAKSILKLVLSKDIDKLINEAQYLSDISRIDNAILEGDDMSTSDRNYVDRVSLFDLLTDIQDKSIEQIDTILKDLKDGVKAGREKYKAANIIRAMARQEVKDRVTKQIFETNPIMFTPQGELLTLNELNNRQSSILKSWAGKNYFGPIKDFVDSFSVATSDAMMRAFAPGKYLLHIQTISNALDRLTDGKSSFTDNVVRPLNRAYEAEVIGKEKANNSLDEIGKDAGYKLGYKGFQRDIHRGGLVLHRFDVKTVGTGRVTTARFTKDELSRIYALSLNDVQNDKLNKQGITPSEIDRIKDILGKDAVKFINGVVDFLSEEYYEGVNDVYSFINGIDLSRLDNYFPTVTQQTSENQKTSETGTTGLSMFSGNFKDGFDVQKASAFYDRLDKTSEVVLKSESFTDALNNHIRQIEKYKAYAQTVNNIDAFLKIPAVDMLIGFTRTKTAITNLLDGVVSPPSISDMAVGGVFNRTLQGIFVGIAITSKVAQLPRQASSFIEAFPSYSFFPEGSKKAMIPGVDLIGYTYDMARVLLSIPKDVGGVLGIPGMKGYITEIYNNSATFRERVKQNMKGDIFSLESGRGSLVRSEGQSRTAVARRRFQVAKGIFVTGGDLLGVLGYLPNYRRDRLNGMTVAEAVEKFNDYDLTQQPKRPTGRSSIQISKNVYLGYLTMFASAQLAKLNTATSAMTNIMRDTFSGKKAKKKSWRKFFMAASLSNVFYKAVTYAALLSGDDDDKDKFLDEMLKAATTIQLLEVIPILGNGIKEIQLNDRVVAALRGREYKEKYSFGASTINPIISEMDRFKRDAKKFKSEEKAALKLIGEIVTKTNLDPYISLGKLIKNDDPQDVVENTLKALGITKTYLPEEYSGATKKYGVKPRKRGKMGKRGKRR